jgi:hypothetical protein
VPSVLNHFVSQSSIREIELFAVKHDVRCLTSIVWIVSCRFRSVAYLQQIWWFEVVGEVDFSFPVGTYSLYFRVHLGKFYKRFGRRLCTSEHVHGWDKKPVRFQLLTSDGQHTLSQCYLEEEPGSWALYHAGDFVASKPDQSLKLKFSMAQIDCTHTKGGLCVDSVFIYPKGSLQQEWVVGSKKVECR